MVSNRPPVRFGVLGHRTMSIFSRCIRPTRIKCRVRQFADETIVYFTIKPHVSAQSLEKDLHNIELRTRVVTRIKPDKRFVLGIHKQNKLFIYTLHNTARKTTANAKIFEPLSVRTSISHLSYTLLQTKPHTV